MSLTLVGLVLNSFLTHGGKAYELLLPLWTVPFGLDLYKSNGLQNTGSAIQASTLEISMH